MRLIGWMLKIVLLVVMVSGLTVLTTGMVVNAYIQSVLQTFNIQLEGTPLTLSSIWKGAWSSQEPGTLEEEEVLTKEAVTNAPVQAGNDMLDQQAITPRQSEEQQGQSTDDDEEAPDNALPVMGQQSIEDQQIVMTPEEMGRAKDELQPTEKEEIFRILMTKLPQEEMQGISEAMEGGLTEPELQQIEEVLMKYLNQEEYEELTRMLIK